MAMKIPPSVLQTPGFAHYSVAWSPFHPNRLAVASSANFGLVGNGRLHLVGVGGAPAPGGPNVPSLTNDKYFATQDGLFDVAWSECHENQLVTSSGDGSLKLWDATLKVSRGVSINFMQSVLHFSSLIIAFEVNLTNIPFQPTRICQSVFGRNIREKRTQLIGQI